MAVCARQSGVARGALVLAAGVALGALFAAVPALAAVGADLHGFHLAMVSARAAGEEGAGEEGPDDLAVAEERIHLELEAWAENKPIRLEVEAEAIYDAVDSDLGFDLREAYLDLTQGRFDLRLGRQIITWGVGDLLFINDVFPKDFVSFFVGRPSEYLKLGADALRARISTQPVNLEIVLIPRFRQDELPTPGEFFLPDPFPGLEVVAAERPEASLGGSEIALRAYRRLGGFDTSFYAYRGYFRRPAAPQPTAGSEVRLFFPRLSSLGASAQGGALGGVLSLEAGYQLSRDDRAATRPGVPNSRILGLVGYQRQLRRDLRAGVQYFVEIPAEDSDPPAEGGEEFRDTLTLRLEQSLRYETWRLSFFAFYSPAQEDYLLQPSVSYRISDAMSLVFGANFFGGSEGATFLGQLDRDDNFYLDFRQEF